MKKLVSLALALIMVLALAGTALAYSPESAHQDPVLAYPRRGRSAGNR